MSERISFESAQKKALDVARTRLVVGGALMAAAFLVIGVRLVDVTVFSETEPSRRASARNIVADRHMDRADIVDRNGVLLATNLTTASLYADPGEIFDPPAAARALVRVLPDYEIEDRSAVWLVYPRSNVLTAKVRVFIDFLVEKIGTPPIWER